MQRAVPRRVGVHGDHQSPDAERQGCVQLLATAAVVVGQDVDLEGRRMPPKVPMVFQKPGENGDLTKKNRGSSWD